jgi:hypothetical protein
MVAVTIGVAIHVDNFSIMAIAFVLLVFAFAWLVSRQSRVEKQKQYYDDLQQVNENEIASIQTRNNIYNDGARYANDKHFYTSDLDIYGNALPYISSLTVQLPRRAITNWPTGLMHRQVNKPYCNGRNPLKK